MSVFLLLAHCRTGGRRRPPRQRDPLHQRRRSSLLR
jgi:hypothetical protein